jgi:hypothetical protein
MRFFRRAELFAIILALILLVPAKSRASGAHVLVLRPQSPDSWLVDEYVDCAFAADYPVSTGSGLTEIAPALTDAAGDNEGCITPISAREQPLIVFAAEDVGGLEDRIALSLQKRKAVEIDSEIRRQILKGLFQPPLWPYLAASEIPGGGINLDRAARLPYENEEQFPVTVFAEPESIGSWNVAGTGNDKVFLSRGGDSEAGSNEGIHIQYLYNCRIEDAVAGIPAGASISAVYVLDGPGYAALDVPAVVISTEELTGLAIDPTSPRPNSGRISEVRINDEAGSLARFIVAAARGAGPRPANWTVWAGPVTVDFSSDSGLETGRHLSETGLLIALLACWLGFGLVIVFGNMLTRFTVFSPLTLLGLAMCIYPLFAAACLLTAGFWGMGFVPSAVLAAGLLGVEGRRTSAFWTILAASVVTTLISAAFSG